MQQLYQPQPTLDIGDPQKLFAMAFASMKNRLEGQHGDMFVGHMLPSTLARDSQVLGECKEWLNGQQTAIECGSLSFADEKVAHRFAVIAAGISTESTADILYTALVSQRKKGRKRKKKKKEGKRTVFEEIARSHALIFISCSSLVRPQVGAWCQRTGTCEFSLLLEYFLFSFLFFFFFFFLWLRV